MMSYESLGECVDDGQQSCPDGGTGSVLWHHANISDSYRGQPVATLPFADAVRSMSGAARMYRTMRNAPKRSAKCRTPTLS